MECNMILEKTQTQRRKKLFAPSFQLYKKLYKKLEDGIPYILQTNSNYAIAKCSRVSVLLKNCEKAYKKPVIYFRPFVLSYFRPLNGNKIT